MYLYIVRRRPNDDDDDDVDNEPMINHRKRSMSNRLFYLIRFFFSLHVGRIA